ncbi:MAG: AAA family ATPase [Sulfolobaceae archaeon]
MKVRVYNIGGIRQELELEIPKSVTIYKAPNAYGKTSLARALVSLLTSSIKAEDLLNVFSDEGYVEVKIDGKEYYRRIRRVKNKIVEDKKLIVEDEVYPLIIYFSPENRLVNHIIGNNSDIEWFISSVSKIQELKKKKDEIEQRLQISKQDLERLEKEYREVLEIQEKIRILDEQLERLEKESESINLLNKVDTTLLTTRKNRLDELREKIELKREELTETEKRLEKINKEIENLESKISSINKDSLLNEIEKINSTLQVLTKDRNSLEVETKLLERILEDLKEADKVHSTTCYLCGNTVDPSIWKLRIEKITEELRIKQGNYDKISKEIYELQSRKTQIEQLLKDLEQSQSELSKLRSKREELLQKIELLKYQIGDLERQKREMEERFSRSDSLISFEMQKDVITKKIEELRAARDKYIYELQMLGMPTSILEKISMKKREIESLEEEAEKLQKEYIRRLTSVREEFTRLSKIILKELDFDLNVEIDSNNKIRVYRNNVELEIRKLATSEKISIALILILAALKAYYTSIPFFIVDESFMTFDPIRFDKLVKILNSMTEYIIITKSDETVEKVVVPKVSQVSSSEVY